MRIMLDNLFFQRLSHLIFSPQRKYYALKSTKMWNEFEEDLNNGATIIFFSKDLPRDGFEYLRKKLMGS